MIRDGIGSRERVEWIRAPDQTTAEIVIRLGSQASILLDTDDRSGGPPCLCIQGGGIQLLLYPHRWLEHGEVVKEDVDRLSDLLMGVTRMRDAVLRQLQRQDMHEAEGATT